MNHVQQSLSSNNENDKITNFELKNIIPFIFDKYMIKYLIDEENEVTFWYWKNNGKYTIPLKEADKR